VQRIGDANRRTATVPGRRLSEVKLAEEGGCATLPTTKYEPDMVKTDRDIEVGNRMKKHAFWRFGSLQFGCSEVYQTWHIVRELSNEHYIKNQYLDLIWVVVLWHIETIILYEYFFSKPCKYSMLVNVNVQTAIEDLGARTEQLLLCCSCHS